MLRLSLACAIAAAAILGNDLFAAARPNIVIILADDLGYGDLGCYGHPSIRTPHLDRMAAEGMRFTDFYSSAEVCTPSRAGLLTGRYAVRSGMCGDEKRVLTATATGGLPDTEMTIAQALKARGYATACIGKWHLGLKPEFNPLRRGFDSFFGLPHSNDMNPTTNAPKLATLSLDQDERWWNAPLYRDYQIVRRPADQRALTRRYTEEALAFMERNRQKPFFLYFAHTFPHVPLFASTAFSGKSARGLYGDVVEELDWSVGEILQFLRKQGLDRNTLVVFTSDNGPWLTQKLAGGSAGLLRDGKGSTYEGGMRVPCIAWWPSRIKPGITSALACNLDLFNTSLTLAGAAIPADRQIDGVDLSPLLFGKAAAVRQEFFYYRGCQLFAVRKGDFKAHYLTRAAYGKDEAHAHDPPLLFNLRIDPSEEFNVATNHPGVLTEIAAAKRQHENGLRRVVSQVDD